MCDAENKVDVDQSTKILIVLRPDAIVQPMAVVIEFLAAAITGAAVLRLALYIGIADVAEEVHWFASIVPNSYKNLIFNLHFSLFTDQNVSWNRCSANVCQINRGSQAHNQDGH